MIRTGMTFWRQFRRADRGAIAVEAVLISPFLIGLGLVAADTSMMMLHTHKMENGLTAAANYLARSNNPNSLETQARNLAVTGQLASGGQPRVPGWASTNVSVQYRTTPNNNQFRAGANVRVVRLSSTYQYKGIGLLSTLRGGSVTIETHHEERIVGG